MVGSHGAALALALAHDHHARILEAVEAGDAEAAGRAMREHMEANYQHLTEVPEPVTELPGGAG